MKQPKSWRENASSLKSPGPTTARKVGPGGRLIRGGSVQRVGKTKADGYGECKIASLNQGKHPAKGRS